MLLFGLLSVPFVFRQQFVDDHDIELIFLGSDSPSNPWTPISEETVIAALKLILDPGNYPLHVMCGLGRHKTGERVAARQIEVRGVQVESGESQENKWTKQL